MQDANGWEWDGGTACAFLLKAVTGSQQKRLIFLLFFPALVCSIVCWLPSLFPSDVRSIRNTKKRQHLACAIIFEHLMQHVLEMNASFVCYVRVWHVPLFFICSLAFSWSLFFSRFFCWFVCCYCCLFHSLCSCSIFNAYTKCAFPQWVPVCVCATLIQRLARSMLASRLRCMHWVLRYQKLHRFMLDDGNATYKKNRNEEAFCPQVRIRDHQIQRISLSAFERSHHRYMETYVRFSIFAQQFFMFVVSEYSNEDAEWAFLEVTHFFPYSKWDQDLNLSQMLTLLQIYAVKGSSSWLVRSQKHFFCAKMK